MNSHTLGAAVVVGWLLMLRPMEHTPDGKLQPVDAPVPTWQQVSAYDTAAACEKARKTATGGALGRQDLDSAVTMHHTRCVPTEAVYPPVQRTP